MAHREYLALLLLASAPWASAAESLGLRVPEGFEVTLYADDDLAHDIHSMTLDSQGRVVVSAPGYVRILLDRNNDGKADAYQQFVDGPKTGAQGMCFDGNDLLCTGDAGLIRYRDRDGDGRADGPPETLLKIKTGGEHTAHAVQRGPDGWWYVIAGNHSGVDEKYASLPTSPIRRPHAGVLLRLPPDFSGSEIIADGFRNAYDFAFNSQGDIFTYDSDGEREVTLPWYQPTRVFHVMIGSNAGWVSESWKKPDYFPDMPPVIASLGRGSPTGVVCYQHRQFPAEYHDALFVCDWTFGRVVALPLTRNHETWKTTPRDFMTGVGQFGFAPTDIEVGPDGSLFISVGGRGTRGSVYRVRYTKVAESPAAKAAQQKGGDPPEGAPDSKELSAVVGAPQPLAAWSRARWLPLAKGLPRDAFLDAACDKTRPSRQRIRAIEICTELFHAIDEPTLGHLSAERVPQVFARGVWSLGRSPRRRVFVEPFVNSDPLVIRCAIEAFSGNAEKRAVPGHDELVVGALTSNLVSDRRYVAHAARIVTSQLSAKAAKELKGFRDLRKGEIALAQARASRHDALEAKALEFATSIAWTEAEYIGPDLIRMMQLALGDLGAGKHAPVFDGYVGRYEIHGNQKLTEPLSKALAWYFPTRNELTNIEMSRTLAMLRSDNGLLLDRILGQVNGFSQPTDDVHYLIVAARNACKRSAAQRQAIAQALVQLDAKIEKLKLARESSWEARMAELYAELVRLDPELPAAIVGREGFGRPDHTMFVTGLPKEELPQAIAAFVAAMEKDQEYSVTPEVVFLLGRSEDTRHRELVRKQYQRFALRGSVLLVLAKQPEVKDTAKFVEGLDAAELEVLSACVDALAKLPPAREAREQVALVRTLRRLGGEAREYPLRERVARLLRRAWQEDSGFVYGKEGHRPQPQAVQKWTDFISEKFPEEAARQFGGGRTEWHSVLQRVDWSLGDSRRGMKLFEARACSRCHGGRTALGPDLAGVARRFSRDDLFTAILDPHRDVSPRYQTTLIQTADGKTHSGLVIYESIDGVTLRDATNQTLRIDGKNIEQRRKINTSLMPTGLLNDLKPADLADLYAYLQSLK